MIDKNVIKTAIDVLTSKNFCKSSRTPNYIDFTNIGKDFIENKTTTRWSYIFKEGKLWVPLYDREFCPDVGDTWRNWVNHWGFRLPDYITENMFKNFCKFFEIETELGFGKTVYLNDDDEELFDI